MSYILPNRVSFLDSIFMKYHPKDYSDDYPYQRLIKEYLNFKTPYHGLLLYFGLGTGKTKTSLEVAKSFIQRNKKVHVILPASLEKNYVNEILKHTFLRKLKKEPIWTQLTITKNDTLNKIKEEYGFKPKRDKGVVWIANYKDDIENAVIVKTNISYKDIDDLDKKLVDDSIKKEIGKYFSFIHYNGLNAKMLDKLDFDDSLIIIDEVHKFIGTVTNQRSLAMKLYNSVLDANRTKILCLSGTPLINSPFELANLINLVRGNIVIYKILYSDDNKKRVDIRDIPFNKYIDTINLDNEGIEITFVPSNFIKDGTHQVKFEPWKDKNPNTILLDIMKSLKKKGFSFRAIPKKFYTYALPPERQEFEEMFINKKDDVIIGPINDDLFKRRIIGTVSFYQRVGSDYPDSLPDMHRVIPMSDYQFNKYMDSREKENKIDQNNKKRKNPLDDVGSVFKAFSRMACNFVFPPDMERPFPTDIRKGIKKMLMVPIDEDDEDDEDNEVKNTAKDINDMVKTKYEGEIDNAMTMLKSMSIDELNLEATSPKFAAMIQDIEECPGKALVYSQFRTVEGIGIFSIVLDKIGFIQVDIKKIKGEYKLVNKNCFDDKYDNKRYVIFNDDAERTGILMAIFNGVLDDVPNSIKEEIDKNKKSNLYGDNVKVMMITESAAEGVSFSNVRRVLLMEPYWNNVIIEQVIGRAIRNRSHINLPLEDRNVQAFQYIMTSTPEQQKNNATFRIQDDAKTTDEAILELANKKQAINSVFLEMLIETSIDCAIHAKTQMPKKCYSWAINLDKNIEAYKARFSDENKHMNHIKLQKTKRIQGVPVYKNDEHYVAYDNKLYDIDGYKYAKKLIKSNIS